jgi:hypothetical protein
MAVVRVLELYAANLILIEYLITSYIFTKI